MRQNFILLLLLFSAALARAQDRAEVETDSAETPGTSLTLASVYASDASYYGQTAGDRLPYVLANASLSLPSGFFISAGAYKLINYGSGISGIDLTAGYDFNITKNLSSTVSFTRSFFPGSALLLQSTNVNMASAALNYDWQWLTTGLNADYAIGDQNALYMTFDASKFIAIASLTAKDYISVEPTFQLVGGTQRIATIEQVPQDESGGDGLIPFPGKSGKKEFLPLPVSKNKNPQYREVENSSFDLLSYNFKLPLAYNRSSYVLEATYQASVLSKQIEGASQKPRSFFFLGFYYMF